MAEAIFYGLTAALVFLGVLAVFYITVLHCYKPQGNVRYILTLPTDARKDEISSLICGMHIRNMIFGDLVSDGMIVLDTGLSEAQRETVYELTAEYGCVKVLTLDEFVGAIDARKEENGTESC